MHCLSVGIRKTSIITGGKHRDGMRCISMSIRRTIIIAWGGDIISNRCTSVIVVVICTNMRILSSRCGTKDSSSPILILRRRKKVLRLRFYLWPSPFVCSQRRRFIIRPIAFMLRALVIAMLSALFARELFGPPKHIRVGTRSRSFSSHLRL